MIEARNWIDGQATDSKEVAEVYSPRNPQERIGSYVLSGTAEVAAAVAAARKALETWRRWSGPARGNVLYQAAEVLAAHAEEIAELASLEMGKPITESRGEAARGVAILRYYAGEGTRAVGEVIPASDAATLQYTLRVPVGVVGVITPWNFPIAIPLWKVAPALAYGNTVVLKPAELASLTAYRMVSLLAPLFPPGTLNLILGRGAVVGSALVEHPGVDAISFTGSTAVGERIAAAAVARGAKYQLEMGGKNPVIVAEDADLDLAVEKIISGAMRSAGQKCTATSRVIAIGGVRDALLERLVRRATALRLGDPLDPDTYLGPVVSEAQYGKVTQLIAAGRREGARLLVGGEGERPNGGYYVPPTVFTDVAPTMTIAQEEIFGPVVGVLAAEDIEEAIHIANGVRYGLSASIFTSDLKTALAFVEGIEAGMVRVNEETAGVEYQAPFGGIKASSSHSREQGRSAMDFYTYVKTVAIRPA